MARVHFYFVGASCCVIFLFIFLYTQNDLVALSQQYYDKIHDTGLSSHSAPLTDDDYARLINQVQNQTTKTDLWTPEFTEVLGDLDGIILDNARQNITSPNGIYTLSLLANANLVLSRATALDANEDIWWTGGGRLGRKGWEVYNEVKIDMTGNLTVGRRIHPYGKQEEEKEYLNWHSNLLAHCAYPDIDEWQMKLSTGKLPGLRLYNSGEITIAGRCTIFAPPAQEKQSKLALIVSGLFRTLLTTCHQHVEKIAQHPSFASTDVFLYALYEKQDITEERSLKDIEDAVRMCYGPHLRTIRLEAVGDVEEPFHGKINPHCGGKLNRLQSQLKTLFISGQAWQNWTIQTGKLHDTVMRVRTDNKFWGEENLNIESPADLGDNTLVIPLLMEDDIEAEQYYCPSPDGDYHIGTGDQIAYGSPAAMAHFLNLYRDFAQMIEQAAPDSKAHHNFFGCSTLPKGPRYEDCTTGSDCSIECMVAWYLRLRGVHIRPEWNWKTNMLRGSSFPS